LLLSISKGRQMKSAREFACVVLVAGTAFLLSGCANPVKQLLSSRPAAPGSAMEVAATSTNPAERTVALRKVAAEASQVSASEREQIAARLAGMLPREDDPRLRVEILQTLAQYPSSVSAQVTQAALHDESTEVRIAVCRVLGERRGADSVKRLSQVVQEEDNVDVRIEAVRALGAIGGDAALPVLQTALDDDDPAVQFVTMDALRGVTGLQLENDVALWRDHLDGKRGPPPQTGLAERVRSWFY
ncbi:MAG: HEAT repeat domain-containing protein, partial [Planctomycetales bacterium]